MEGDVFHDLKKGSHRSKSVSFEGCIRYDVKKICSNFHSWKIPYYFFRVPIYLIQIYTEVGIWMPNVDQNVDTVCTKCFFREEVKCIWEFTCEFEKRFRWWYDWEKWNYQSGWEKVEMLDWLAGRSTRPSCWLIQRFFEKNPKYTLHRIHYTFESKSSFFEKSGCSSPKFSLQNENFMYSPT